MTFDVPDQSPSAEPPKVRIPGGDETREMNAEQTALAQFNILVNRYAQSIATMNGAIGGIDGEIKVLEAGIERLRADRAVKVRERDTKFALMEGVNKLIREQEDAIRERERHDADEARRRQALG